MAAEILELHPISSIGHVLRLGHTGHKKLENLHASGRFPIERAVADAAHLGDQRELLDSLQRSSVEIVLDTRVAELSTAGGYQTSARRLPWALPNRPYSVEGFGKEFISDLMKKIADFAIENRVDVILAPTHLLNSPRDEWFSIDMDSCLELRKALDSRGGQSVSIDYPLLATYQVLLNGTARKFFVGDLTNLPFDNLWLRTANFGSDKSAAGLCKYIAALRDFHEVAKPLIADGIGGLPALGIVAFGAASGICHGIAEKERFYPRWSNLPKTGRGGGSRKRVYFPALDAYLFVEDARALLSTRGAKPLLGCRDTGCCPGGWEDMIIKPKTHYLNQTFRRFRELSNVPDLRRIEHFISHQLTPADRSSRSSLRLPVKDVKIAEKLKRNSRRLDDMRHAMEELQVTSHNSSRSVALGKRARRRETRSIFEGR